MTEEKKEEYYELLGKNIIRRRRELGLTRKDVAQKLGILESLVHKYEHGVVRIPVDRLFALAIFFKTNLLYFFAGVEKEFPPNDLPKQSITDEIDPLIKQLQEKLKELEKVNSLFSSNNKK